MPKKGATNAGDDDEFESAASGASDTIPKQCSALRKNEVCMIKGRPCKIVDMSTSKTGKHGHAKVHLVGIDIFEGKKYEDICPSTHNMEVPIVKTSNYTLTDINDEGFLGLMDDSAEVREDLRLPTGKVGDEIKERFDNGEDVLVTVIKALKEEKVQACKAITTTK